AIKECTELGSGFKITMRDLSIRGAGNLLGAQQHGFVDSVGFDMYSQVLKEAIEARKSGKELEVIEIVVLELTLHTDAYIPETYIPDEKQKIDMYKQFQAISSYDDIRDLQDELIDRFGDYPQEVDHLFTVTRLKMLAKREGVESITEKNKKIELIITVNCNQKNDYAKLFEVASEFGRQVLLGTEHNKLKITFQTARKNKYNRYAIVGDFMNKLTSVNR